MSLDGRTNLFQAGDDVRDELGGGHGLLDEVEAVVVQAGCVRVGNVERFCMAKWTMAIYWGTGDSRGSPTCGLHQYISRALGAPTCMVSIH